MKNTTTRIVQLGLALGLTLPALAAQQLAAPTLTSRQPATIEGTLNYANLQYWVKTSTGEHIAVTPEEKDEMALVDKVGKTVTLKGFNDIYSNGSHYFVPTLTPDPSSSPALTIVKQDDGSIEIRQGDEILRRTEMYYTINIAHEQLLPHGHAVLFELDSGGVACPRMYQLVVTQPRALTMLSPDFGTCSDEGKLTPEANGFTLDLPGNPRQRWVWDANSLTLHKQS